MATRTFVADGTSRNWSATGTWAEGVVPTAADDVVFSTNVASSILVIDGTSGSPSLCRSINTTGYTRSITQASAKFLVIGDGGGGSMTLTASLVYAPNNGSTVKFVSTITGNTITVAGHALPNITFDGVGGEWTLQDAADSAGNASPITLTNGSFITGGNAIGALNGWPFSSSNSNTRSLTLGATNWNIGGGTGSWDITNSTGMTLSAASSTIQCSSTSAVGAFNGGGLTYGTVTCTSLTTSTVTVSGANTIGTLTLSMAGSTKTNLSGYKLSANQTVTGTFTANGNSAILRNFIYSSVLGTAITITAATVVMTKTDFRDITGAGAGDWNFSSAHGVVSQANAAGNCGGNSGITFNAPKNCYMKTAVSVNWSASNWFTASGGSTPISPVIPLPQDTAFFDANSVTAGSKTITVDEARIPATDWSNVANSPTWTMNNSTEVYGSLTMASTVTYTSTGQITFCGRASNTLKSAGKSWPATLNINAPNGTITQQDNLTFGASSDLSIVNGTWANSTFACGPRGLLITGGAFTAGSNITGLGTGSIQITTGALNIQSFTLAGFTGLFFGGGGTINVTGSSSVSGAAGVSFTTTGVGGAGGGKILASSIIQGLGVI